MGVELDDVGKVDWRSTVLEEDLPYVDDWWHKLTILKQTSTFQFRLKTPFKSGQMELPYHTVLCACYVDFDEGYGIETVMSLVLDISEQKWIEDQLLERTRKLEDSETRYRLLSDLSPLGIVSTDRHGNVQFGNEAWHDFYGFKKGQAMDPQPWLPYICDEHVQKAREYFGELQTKKGPRTIEFRLKRKFTLIEGDKILENDIWVLASGVGEYSADGQLDHIDFWVTDISAQKMAARLMSDKMEEAIRTRKQQERFIDMISHEIRNPLSAVLHCGEEIIESIKQCLQQPNGTQVNHPITTTQAQTVLTSALDAASTITYCVQHQKQIVDDVLTLSKLDSNLLVVSPVPTKLTDLMLSAAKIFEPELRMSDIDFDIVEDDSVARHHVDWLLLDPSRFLQIVINLLTNAIKFTRTSSQRSIKVTTSIHTSPPRQLGDIDFVPRRFHPLERRGSLVQVMTNGSDTQLYLRVSVSDTGRGLLEEEKKLLFQRFAQASPKTSVEYGGSGLGLFISRQISELLGGEIGVGSSASGGCTFAFYIATSRADPPSNPIPDHLRASPPLRPSSAPLILDQNGKQKKPTDKAMGSAGQAKTSMAGIRRVLVVEDNMVNQKVLCKQLRNRGFSVEASNHGLEALMALEAANGTKQIYFDVVLCDIEMPIMDGIECVREIRKREDEGALPGHIPIIGVTANVRSKQVDSAIESGMVSREMSCLIFSEIKY